MSKEVEFAKLSAVEWDRDTDRVWVKFEVFDQKYKDFALRVANREEIEFAVAGEKLMLVSEPEDEGTT